MSFKTATCHYNSTVVKAEISIPRNSVVENDAVIQGDVRSETSVNSQINQEQNYFGFG